MLDVSLTKEEREKSTWLSKSKIWWLVLVLLFRLPQEQGTKMKSKRTKNICSLLCSE
jgi:hypothetical protein